MIRFRRPTNLDFGLLARDMRHADKEELAASNGETPAQALHGGILRSDNVWVAAEKDVPICVFGTVPTETPGVGIVWLLGTDLLDRRSKALLRQSREWVRVLRNSYDVLFNYVDCRNTKTRRWLKWLGFREVAVDQRYGVARLPFVLVQLGE